MTKNTTEFLIQTIMTIMIISLITGCASGGTGITGRAAQPAEKTKIGVVTPLSGDAAFLGQNVLRSAELTLKYYNLSDQIELVTEDVQCAGHGADAVKAASRLIDIERVQAVIGGACSDETLAMAPLFNSAKVPYITPLTGGQNIDEAGEYVFRNGPSDIRAGTRPAQEILSRFKIRNTALVTDQAAYTKDIAQHFKDEYRGNIIFEADVPVGESDLRTTAAKIKASGAEGVLILTQDGVSAAYLIKQLREEGSDAKIFSNFIAFSPKLTAIAGDAAEGAYIYDPEFEESNPDVKKFLEEYKKKWGMDSPIPFHTTGTRDAIIMITQAADARGNHGERIHDWLLAYVREWSGFNGNATFDKQGNTQTGFVLKQVRGGKLEPIG
ncbi:MAG: ABC transporter substrate-binding protein [Nanoarchaeota archaeon]